MNDEDKSNLAEFYKDILPMWLEEDFKKKRLQTMKDCDGGAGNNLNQQEFYYEYLIEKIASLQSSLPLSTEDQILLDVCKNYLIANRCNVLIFAIEKNDLNQVRQLLDLGMEVNVVDNYGTSALETAVSFGNKEIVELLVSKDVNLEIELAIINGQKEVLKFLYEKYNSKIDSKYFKQILELAEKYSPSITKFLIEKIARLELSEQTIYLGKRNFSAINYAFLKNDTELFRSVLDLTITQNKNGISICKTKDPSGCNALHLAVKMKDIISISKLLDCRLDVYSTNYSGYNALNLATEHNNFSIIKLLLENGADINQDNINQDKINRILNIFAISLDQSYKKLFEFFLKRYEKFAVTGRNANGKNILDLLFRYCKANDYYKPLVLDCVKDLPTDKQTEFLKNVTNIGFLGSLFYRDIYTEEKRLSPLTLCIKYIKNTTNKYSKNNSDNNIKYKEDFLQKIGFMWFTSSLRVLYDTNAGDHYSLVLSNLIQTFKEAKITLLLNNGTTEDLLSFKKTCIDAIETARPVSKPHYIFAQFIAKCVIVLITFPISLPLYALGLFSFKPYSEQLLDSFIKKLDNFPEIKEAALSDSDFKNPPAVSPEYVPDQENHNSSAPPMYATDRQFRFDLTEDASPSAPELDGDPRFSSPRF